MSPMLSLEKADLATKVMTTHRTAFAAILSLALLAASVDGKQPHAVEVNAAMPTAYPFATRPRLLAEELSLRAGEPSSPHHCPHHKGHWHTKTYDNVTEERRHYFHTSEELGLFVARLSGVMEDNKTSYPPEEVTVHFYLRSMPHNATMAEVSGLYFVESMERFYYNVAHGGAHISQPPLAVVWKPRIFLRLPGSEEEWDFTTSQHMDGDYEDEQGQKVPFASTPHTLKLLIPTPVTSDETVLEIGIQGFKRVVRFPFDQYHMRPVQEKTDDPQVWLLVKTPFAWDGVTIAQQIIYHNVYHTRLGFAGTIQYVDLNYLSLLLMNPGILELIDAGFLRLILWDKMMACAEYEPCYVGPSVKPWLTQPLQYSHAMMAFRGQNLLLALVDHDEYLAVNRAGQSVQQLLRECWGGARFIHLDQFKVVPANDNGSDWSPYWMPGGYKVHPLEHYHKVRWESGNWEQGKSIVDPDAMDVCYIHYCNYPDGTRAVINEHEGPESENTCAYWIHVVNQHSVRMGREEKTGTVGIEKWRWVLDKL